MNKKLLFMALVVGMFLIPAYAGASQVANVGDIVFEVTDWIVLIDGLSYDFVANVAPYEYLVTLSDLSEAPTFGITFIYLAISTSTDFIDSTFGPGSFTFTADPGETYFVNVFGIGGGELFTGLFGVNITAVPIPTSLLLFGSGILGLVFLRRRKH
jgi:hypothetical protein